MSEARFTFSTVGIAAGIAAMAVIVALSNYLVQFAINDWLTWAAFSYPVAFLVTDLTNRSMGPRAARLVICAGFALAVVLSLWLADPRIALASGSAFLVAQLLDVAVFNRLRSGVWWSAPLVSSTVGSIVDTALFWSIAFVGTGLPWQTWALGDFAVKMAMTALMLLPFRLLMPALPPRFDKKSAAQAYD
ncbi:queuosine precursor transporter [Pelagibius litoralis]|uniref:Probable queuosine precursor transporter n=1 Tax=Pelagibius litoralis TaxID=374515 RepID=A0A967EZ78_9PROT|nr:queuosine precursor transporter [Pelagibius litoralis]NIA70173.1 queuosine precursor transporter [Pelagibius litoralis]